MAWGGGGESRLGAARCSQLPLAAHRGTWLAIDGFEAGRSHYSKASMLRTPLSGGAVLGSYPDWRRTALLGVLALEFLNSGWLISQHFSVHLKVRWGATGVLCQLSGGTMTIAGLVARGL